MKKISVIILSLLIFAVSSINIYADETLFNPQVEITKGIKTTTVKVDDDSEDAFEIMKPKLTIEVGYADCYVTLNDEDVECVLKDGDVTFSVEKAGIYKIINGPKPTNDTQPATPSNSSNKQEEVVKKPVPIHTTTQIKINTTEKAELVVPVTLIEEENAYNLVVDIPVDIIKAGLTEDEVKLIRNGAEVTIKVETKEIEITKDEQVLVEEIIGKTGTIAKCLDIKLFKQVGDMDGYYISETGKEISLVIDIPQELILNDSNYERTYYLIRIHDGLAERIDGYFDPKTKTLSFDSDKFSTYVLAYEDRMVGNPEPLVVTEKKNSYLLPVVCVVAVVGIATLVIALKKKKEN